MNRVFFVRHGEGVDNTNRKFSYKRIDCPLTERGRLQASMTADYMAGKQIDEVFSSPMKRAHETALIIAERLGMEVTVFEGFREVNVGDLEGKDFSAETWSQYHHVVGEWFAGNRSAMFPGGEDYHALWDRTYSAFVQMVNGKTNKNIVLAGHSGIFIATLKDLCPELDINWLQNAEIYNCSVTEMEIDLVGGKLSGRLIDWANYGHMSGEALTRLPGIPPLESVKKK
jgi:2,3-bisphosphoglycerate-dependent phosphoglycerate mutase